MFCTECGTLNPESTRFCTSCGAALKTEGGSADTDATVVDIRPGKAAPDPADADNNATVVAVREKKPAPAPAAPVAPPAPVYADASSAGGDSATVASFPARSYPPAPVIQPVAPPVYQPPAPVYQPPAPAPVQAPYPPQAGYPNPAAYPAQNAYPPAAYPNNGAYPQNGVYQQPATQPRTASMSLPWFMARLPVVGGLLTVIGFVLNWFNSAGSSGLNRLSEGVNALSYVISNGAADVSAGELLFYMILPLLTVLALVAGIFGLLGFLARKGLRLTTTILAVLGLAAVVGYMLVGASVTGVDFGTVASAWSVGYYLLLVGLLWTAVTPWISKQN